MIPSLAIGGAEMQLVRLANGLDRRRFNPSIICLLRGGGLERAVAPDIPLTMSGLAPAANRSIPSRALVGGRIVAALMGSLGRQRPDVVHAYLPVAYVLGGLAAWPLRVPVIIAGRRGLTSFETFGRARWLARLANRVIDVQICNSRAVRDWAVDKERVGIERTRVVHNGIDLPAMNPSIQLPGEWRSNGPTAAMVANLIRYKGHREVLEAVARVVERHPSFRLVLIGDGRERAALTDLAQQLRITQNAIFAGSRADAPELIQAFDFSLLGSSEEGFPNALMESMAYGVPVVSTAVGGVTELVTDGVHGKLVPFGDTAAMADAIVWMIEHQEERRRMGENARARIAGEFSTERMVTATQAVYEEFLHRRVALGAVA